MDQDLSNKIIQTMLYFGEPVKKDELSQFLDVSQEEIESTLPGVKKMVEGLGMSLANNKNKLEIVVGEEVSEIINKNRINELKVELSESALQTLAVVIYKNNVTKAEIDFIRGVDSVRSIKNLVLRGLIEKVEAKSKKYYVPTIETLKFLGISNKEEAPDQIDIAKKLNTLIHGDEN